MQLSLRLSAIADLVTEGNRLVDVGCDHGYLPVYLIQQKKIPSAIAMDVRKGPLSRAQEHIRQYGLEEYIQTRLSDGLEGLKAGEGDTLVIAGMGGPLMERILTDGRSVRNSFSELILQPQSDIPHFRRFIQSEGWEITEEKMVEEDGKFYPMMRVVPGENVHSSLKLNVDSFPKNTSVKAASSAAALAVEIAEKILEDIVHILTALEMIFLIGAIRARIGTAETTPEGIALCISIAASLPCSFIEGGMTKLII